LAIATHCNLKARQSFWAVLGQICIAQ